MTTKYTFGIVDYVVFVSCLAASVAIGGFFAYKGNRNKNTEEYFVVSRKMSLLPVSCSMVVSLISAVLIIGLPAEAYLYGPMMILGILGAIPGAILGAILIVPMFYRLQITSINEVGQ